MPKDHDLTDEQHADVLAYLRHADTYGVVSHAQQARLKELSGLVSHVPDSYRESCDQSCLACAIDVAIRDRDVVDKTARMAAAERTARGHAVTLGIYNWETGKYMPTTGWCEPK